MDPLHLSPDDFHRLADRVTRLATQYLTSLDRRPAFPALDARENEAFFHTPPPEQGQGEGAFDALESVLQRSRIQNGRFFGYVLGSGEPVAALADLLASVINQNVTAWRSGPAAVTIELTVVDWLARSLGCAGFRGFLTGGGSLANLMALAMAREARFSANEPGLRSAPEFTLYASNEIHMSIGKSVALLGLGRSNLRLLPTDDSLQLIPSELEKAIAQDRAAGRTPLAVIASAGTVNTGAIDPLLEISNIARRHRMWFHVDGAYGAMAAMAVPEKFQGLSEADSISLDPHKWLYQPLDCGCLLYRDSAGNLAGASDLPAADHVVDAGESADVVALMGAGDSPRQLSPARKAFSHTGDYARSLNSDPLESFAFFEQSLELSRRFRALKLWLSLRYHGFEAFRAAIRKDLDLARRLAAAVQAEPHLELMAPVELSAVCFRHRGPLGEGMRPPGSLTGQDLNEFNSRVLKRVIERGRVYLSNATLRGHFCLRACLVNHRTTAADVDAVIPEVLAAANEIA
jgi:glutamate/tyrosine decarboxylase-like PLP-dependent enzyme